MPNAMLKLIVRMIAPKSDGGLLGPRIGGVADGAAPRGQSLSGLIIFTFLAASLDQRITFAPLW